MISHYGFAVEAEVLEVPLEIQLNELLATFYMRMNSMCYMHISLSSRHESLLD